MAEDWYAAQPVDGMSPPPPAPAMHNLRPLSLGEILDRTFAIYRSHFWLFVGIASIYAVTTLSLQLLNLAARHWVIVRHGIQGGTLASLGGAGVMLPLLMFPYAIMQAGTVYALSEVYLGKGTTATEAVRAILGRWYRYVAIALWISFSAFWLPAVLIVPAMLLIFAVKSLGLQWLAGLLIFLAFCALPYSVWAILRNLLGVQASVIEGATVRTAMRRSKILTVGAKGRIFVVLLIVLALGMTVGVLQLPILFIVMRAPLQEHNVAQSIQLIVNALAQMVVTPIGLIGLSLVYFDQRVRQEGFDLLLMLGPETPLAAPVAYVEPIASAEPVMTETSAALTTTEEETYKDDGSV